MLTVSFQLPRIAKPSGTSTGPATPRVAPLFQLPRIAKPSGTPPNIASSCGSGLVSTSPDSKAIRNLYRACNAEGGTAVSTSPDSKAIRNPDRARVRKPADRAFQLPRIAKPSGTPQQLGRYGMVAVPCFNFPG